MAGANWMLDFNSQAYAYETMLLQTIVRHILDYVTFIKHKLTSL